MAQISDNDTVTIALRGRIDSNSAADVEKEINEALQGRSDVRVVLNASELEYISSAGLRVILRLKQSDPDIKVTEVSSSVYEIFETTGFTEIMDIEKAYKTISLDGCEEIGRGANGVVYRIDSESVVKVYHDPEALDQILREREVARLVFVLGIPTVISYDVVRVGDSYGSVYELLDATSFSRILAERPERFEWAADEFAKLLKLIHSTEVPEGKLPDIRDTALVWTSFMKDHLPEDKWEKLMSLTEAIPYDSHMIHGDYHTKNVVLQGEDVLLIDMDTISVGYPILELASMYNAFQGYSEYDHEQIMRFQGYDREVGTRFWHRVLEEYLGTRCEAKIREVEDKAKVIGYSRLIRRSVRRNGLESEAGRAEIELWKERLLELLERTDTLLFDKDELEIDALRSNLPEVQSFVRERLENAGFPCGAVMQVDLAVEEIFVNISNYAYAPHTGKVRIKVEVSEVPPEVTVTLSDRGIPYDPLSKKDPDVTLSAGERPIGGLGIFLTKKLMDDISYEYRDGRNILTLKKKAKRAE